MNAATLYWDVNGAAAGSSATSTAAGTWDATTANFNSAASGIGPTAAWTPGDILEFERRHECHGCVRRDGRRHAADRRAAFRAGK
ncbi:MAG: hypothetical protein QM775_11165 [Pirellulales bacterium]